jgi:hypothetical protein
MTSIALHPVATRRPLPYGGNDLPLWCSSNQATWTPGDRPGIFHCSIPKEWANGEIVTLVPGTKYNAVVSLEARKGVDEQPRMTVKVDEQPDAVESADVVLYSKELLGADASSSADYEIVAVRGLTAVPNPRTISTLLHNMFNMSGGTSVEGTAEEKLEMIRQSFMFWKDKATVL